jgi:hypothetical protein
MAENFVAEGQSYTIDQHQYPSNLSDSSEFDGNKVVFFINVQGSSKIVADEKIPTIPLPKYRYLKASGQEAKQALDRKELRITKPTKRLTTAISLYIPESIVKSYGVNWEMDDGSSSVMGDVALKVILAGLNGASNQTLQDGNNDAAIGAAGAAALKAGAAAGGSMLLGGSTFAQKSLGLTPGNAKSQLLFNGVDFGGFTFDYKFAPKNEEEAKKVLNIIRTFRHHMLPEFLDPETKFIYVYPSEFEIRYYRGSEENQYLEHHITAVLTNMNVNYTPNGQYTTFSDGMPTHINMTLQFKELGTPSKSTSPADESGA